MNFFTSLYQKYRTSSVSYLKEAIKENDELLMPGWYIINQPFARKIGSDLPDAVKVDYPYLLKPKSAKGFLLNLMALLFCMKRVSQPPVNANRKSYSLIYRSAKGDLKMFDLKRNVILVRFQSPSKLNRVKEFYSSNQYLPLNMIQFESGNRYTEPVINGVPSFYASDHIQLELYRNLLERFIGKIDEIKKNNFSIFWNVGEANDFFERNIRHIESEDLVSKMNARKSFIEACAVSCPLIFTHGDLSSSNILINGKEYVVIDYEHSSLRHLFHDIINLPFNGMIVGSETVYDRHNFVLNFRDELELMMDKLSVSDGVQLQDLIYIHILQRAADGNPYNAEASSRAVNELLPCLEKSM